MVKIFLIIVAALVLYTINLKGSLGFFDDTARDTIHVLEIVKQRELTLIGPPMSIGLFGIREVYFGSLALYIAAIGLLAGKLDVTGAIYPNIFFFTVSIYFFHKLVRYLTDSKKSQILSTILYALSPVTVTFARFFWNPNLTIPFSVFFWLLIVRKYSSEPRKVIGYLCAGCIGGVMVNFHYVSLISVLFCILLFLFQRKIFYSIVVTLGFLVGSTPLILFELKHKFYLTNALLYNLTHRVSSQTVGDKVLHFFSSTFTIVGIKPSEITHPTIIMSTPFFYYIIACFITFLIITSFHRIPKKGRVFLIPILLLNLAAVAMSAGIYNVHYIFPAYPLFIWYIGHLISSLNNRFLSALIIGLAAASSLLIPYDIHNIKKDYLSITEIESIAQYIVHDNPNPPYNMTENITGGAQAIPFRYILERDAKVPINDKTSYIGLKTLYVVTYDIQKTYRENRYEFYATPNKVLTKEVNFNEVKLYKFEVR